MQQKEEKKADDQMNLVDVDYFSVQESENNLIFTFKQNHTFEAGETITIWTSELVDRRIIETKIKELESSLALERQKLEGFK